MLFYPDKPMKSLYLMFVSLLSRNMGTKYPF